MRASALVLALALLGGCRPEPVPLRYGEDACAHCRMTVSDPRFGAELVAATGRTYPFDAVECLAAFVQAHPEVEVHSLWVVPSDAPGTLVHVEDAFFARSPAVRSPMGAGLIAFSTAAARDAALAGEGEALDWAGVLVRVSEDAPHAHLP
jgi:copper chaperone NosL